MEKLLTPVRPFQSAQGRGRAPCEPQPYWNHPNRHISIFQECIRPAGNSNDQKPPVFARWNYVAQPSVRVGSVIRELLQLNTPILRCWATFASPVGFLQHESNCAASK